MLVNSLKELPLFMVRSMIDSLSSENEFPWNWGRWRLLVACGRVVEGVVFWNFPLVELVALGPLIWLIA